MRKVLIIMGSEMLGQILTDSMKQHYDLTLCTNAEEGAQLLKEEFDGLVLDLFLPGTDGLMLLEQAETLPPVILVLTRLISPYIQQAVQDLGVGYILRIPCRVSDMEARLADMFRRQELPNTILPPYSLEDHLSRLGLYSHKVGYKYLLVVIPLYAKDPLQALSKHIYPVLAKERGTSIDALHNAIHREIVDAWKQRDDAVWKEYFSNTSRCPTNKQFIAALAEKLSRF